MYNIEFIVNGELTESGVMSVEDINTIRENIKKKSIPFYFDKQQMGKIIYEYLGLSEEYIKMIDLEQLKKDINFVIDKYINDTRKIKYILESDIMYACDNKEDINILENINGVIVYEDLI